MQIECFDPKPIDETFAREKWPELASAIRWDALAVSIFLARAYVQVCAERPRVERLGFDSDSMGGIDLDLAMSSPSGRLTLRYEQSLRESWSSIERLRCEAGLETPLGRFTVDLHLTGTCHLTLGLPLADPPLEDAMLTLSREHFAQVETGEELWARRRKEWEGSGN